MKSIIVASLSMLVLFNVDIHLVAGQMCMSMGDLGCMDIGCTASGLRCINSGTPPNNNCQCTSQIAKNTRMNGASNIIELFQAIIEKKQQNPSK